VNHFTSNKNKGDLLVRITRTICLALALSAAAFFMTGCETMSDWFGWGDDAPAAGTGEGAGMDGLVPSDYTAPGENVGSGDIWTPIPGVEVLTVYFAYDQSTIGTSEMSKIQKAADYLNSNSASNMIIEGNCDDRGSLEYNRALGERRAIAVKEALMGLGIADARLRTISYGEERPAVEGSGEAVWAKNRRAELIAAK
jgi:peptidoglycan-associated lipoprotein